MERSGCEIEISDVPSQRISDFLPLNIHRSRCSENAFVIADLFDGIPLDVQDLEQFAGDYERIQSLIQENNRTILTLSSKEKNTERERIVNSFENLKTFLQNVNRLFASQNEPTKSVYKDIFTSFLRVCGVSWVYKEFSHVKQFRNLYVFGSQNQNSTMDGKDSPIGVTLYLDEMFLPTREEKLSWNSSPLNHLESNEDIGQSSTFGKVKMQEFNTDYNVSALKKELSKTSHETEAPLMVENQLEPKNPAGQTAMMHGSFCPFRKRVVEGRIKQPTVKLSSLNSVMNRIPIVITLAPDENAVGQDGGFSEPFKAPGMKLNLPTKLSAGVRSAMEEEFAFTERKSEGENFPFPIIISAPSSAKKAKLAEGLNDEGGADDNPPGDNDDGDAKAEGHLPPSTSGLSNPKNLNASSLGHFSDIETTELTKIDPKLGKCSRNSSLVEIREGQKKSKRRNNSIERKMLKSGKKKSAQSQKRTEKANYSPRRNAHLNSSSNTSSVTDFDLENLTEDLESCWIKSREGTKIIATTENSMFSYKYQKSGKTLSENLPPPYSLDTKEQNEKQQRKMAAKIRTETWVNSIDSENEFLEFETLSSQSQTCSNANALTTNHYKPSEAIIKTILSKQNERQFKDHFVGFIIHEVFVVIVSVHSICKKHVVNFQQKGSNIWVPLDWLQSSTPKTEINLIKIDNGKQHIKAEESKGTRKHIVSYSPVLNILCKADRKFLSAVVLRLLN